MKNVVDSLGQSALTEPIDINILDVKKTVTTESDGSYSVSGPGSYILLFEAECYATILRGLAADRTLKSTQEEKSWIIVTTKEETVDVSLSGGCDPVVAEGGEDAPSSPSGAGETPATKTGDLDWNEFTVALDNVNVTVGASVSTLPSTGNNYDSSADKSAEISCRNHYLI